MQRQTKSSYTPKLKTAPNAAPAKTQVKARPAPQKKPEVQSLEKIVQHMLNGRYPGMKVVREVFEGFERRFLCEKEEDKKELIVICPFTWGTNTEQSEQIKAGYRRQIALTNFLAQKKIDCSTFLNEDIISYDNNLTMMVQKPIDGRKKLAHSLIKDKESCETIGMQIARLHQATK